MSDQRLTYRFVETAPDQLEPDVLYVSIEFAMVMHLCRCGCGSEVVTPLSPNDWKLTFDGESISLYPSIGNWSFPCRSHYWIRRNRIEWAPAWSYEEISEGRMEHQKIRRRRNEETHVRGTTEPPPRGEEAVQKPNVWSRLRMWISG